MTSLCLKHNNCLSNDPCALCGERCDPTGLDVFVEGTYKLVCDQCADELAPVLQAMRRASQCHDRQELERRA